MPGLPSPDLVPPPWFLTTSTVFSALELRVYCTPLSTLRFVTLHVASFRSARRPPGVTDAIPATQLIPFEGFPSFAAVPSSHAVRRPRYTSGRCPLVVAFLAKGPSIDAPIFRRRPPLRRPSSNIHRPKPTFSESVGHSLPEGMAPPNSALASFTGQGRSGGLPTSRLYSANESVVNHRCCHRQFLAPPMGSVPFQGPATTALARLPERRSRLQQAGGPIGSAFTVQRYALSDSESSLPRLLHAPKNASLRRSLSGCRSLPSSEELNRPSRVFRRQRSLPKN